MTAASAISAKTAALGRAAALLQSSGDAELREIGELIDSWPSEEVERLLGIRHDEQLAAAIAERNRLLIMAAEMLPERSIRQKAARLHDLLARYRAGRWRAGERLLKDCPFRPSIDAALWRLLRVRDAIPSAELIRKILRG